MPKLVGFPSPFKGFYNSEYWKRRRVKQMEEQKIKVMQMVLTPTFDTNIHILTHKRCKELLEKLETYLGNNPTSMQNKDYILFCDAIYKINQLIGRLDNIIEAQAHYKKHRRA